jgi:hypothetical protein
VSYAYDGLGRRKSKTVNGTTTLYVSDGDREALEYDGSTGAVLRRYTYGAGIDEALNLVSAAGDPALGRCGPPIRDDGSRSPAGRPFSLDRMCRFCSHWPHAL